MHFYKLVDDPPGSYNYKGLMFNNGPYNPPYFPGGPPYGKKPVYEAVKFINTHRCDEVVQSTCSHPEIVHTVTLRADHTGLTLLAANLFRRTITLDTHITLSLDMRDGSYIVQYHWIDETGSGVTPAPLLTPILGELDFTVILSPETLYAVELRYIPRGLSVLPTASPWRLFTVAVLALISGFFIITRCHR